MSTQPTPARLTPQQRAHASRCWLSKELTILRTDLWKVLGDYFPLCLNKRATVVQVVEQLKNDYDARGADLARGVDKCRQLKEQLDEADGQRAKQIQTIDNLMGSNQRRMHEVEELKSTNQNLTETVAALSETKRKLEGELTNANDARGVQATIVLGLGDQLREMADEKAVINRELHATQQRLYKLQEDSAPPACITISEHQAVVRERDDRIEEMEKQLEQSKLWTKRMTQEGQCVLEELNRFKAQAMDRAFQNVKAQMNAPSAGLFDGCTAAQEAQRVQQRPIVVRDGLRDFDMAMFASIIGTVATVISIIALWLVTHP